MKTLGEYFLGVILIIFMIPVFIVASFLALFEMGHYIEIRRM